MWKPKTQQSQCIILHLQTKNIMTGSMEIDNEVYYSSFTQKELEVAHFLLDLSTLFPSFSYPSTSRVNSFPTWVSRKKRSLPSLPQVKKLIPEITSPSSPHSFPPSEEPPHSSHTNPFPPSKLRIKKLKSLYVEAIDTQQTLKKEIEGVKQHRNGLKAENYKLRGELEIGRKGGIEKSEKDLGSRRQETSSSSGAALKYNVHDGSSTSTQVHNSQPLDPSPRVKIQGSHHNPEVGPRGFDLNIPCMEELEVEDKKLEENSYVQMTKLNRERRRLILRYNRNKPKR